jgi:subtilisin family serine protease
VENPANDFEYQDRGLPLEEMIAAGVHHVSAAGNYQSTLIMSDHPNYNDGRFNHGTTAWTKGSFYVTRRSNMCLAGDTIAVAAIASGFNQFTALGGNEHLAGFSCRGERVDCAAAGENINMNLKNNGYYNASGTSFASPNVGGMAACVLEKYPDTTPRQLRKYFRDVAVGTDKLHDSGIGESNLGSDRLDDLFYGNALSCRGYSGNIAYLDPNLVADPRTQTNDPIVSPFSSLTDVTIDYSVAEIQTKLDGLP